VNDDSDHALADASDAFDATDDAIGDTFEVSTRIRIDPTVDDQDAENSLTRLMAIAAAAVDAAGGNASTITDAQLV